jgi:hypothetical protein
MDELDPLTAAGLKGLFEGYANTVNRAAARIGEDKEKMSQMVASDEELQMKVNLNAASMEAIEEGRRTLNEKMGELTRLLDE